MRLGGSAARPRTRGLAALLGDEGGVECLRAEHYSPAKLRHETSGSGCDLILVLSSGAPFTQARASCASTTACRALSADGGFRVERPMRVKVDSISTSSPKMFGIRNFACVESTG